jgi:hypothetical protein
VDHAVPVAVVCDSILNAPNLDRGKLQKILEDLLVAVEVTPKEHEQLLRCGLSDCMPQDWNSVDVFARYRVAGIEIIEFENTRSLG